MKDDTINVRINQYTGAIEAIPEGRRNDGIYNVGLCLRGLFGQTDDALERLHCNERRFLCEML